MALMTRRVAAVMVGIALVGGIAALRTGGVAAQTHTVDPHMVMTTPRPAQPGDQARAAAVAAEAKLVAERYIDYRRALADGYEIFMPNQKQDVYHFVLESADNAARTTFDATKPAALLYKRTGGEPAYKLVGVMYTARFGASEADLDRRIPLSVAQWHEHVNMCIPPDAGNKNWLTEDAKFGLEGSITTADACRAAGGRFMPHLSGWMTHVYPFETDPARVWHAGMGDEAMPGMKM